MSEAAPTTAPVEAVLSRLPSHPPGDLDELRATAEALAADEGLSKECALRVMRLFHGLAHLLYAECTERDGRIARLQFELEKMQVQHAMLNPPPSGRRGR